MCAGRVGLQQQVGRLVLAGAAERGASAPLVAGAVRGGGAGAAPGGAAHAQLRGHPAQLPRGAPHAPPAAQARPAPPVQAQPPSVQVSRPDQAIIEYLIIIFRTPNTRGYLIPN